MALQKEERFRSLIWCGNFLRAVCLYCKAGSHSSWEPGVGANQYKKLLLCFLLTCVSQRESSRGGKGGDCEKRHFSAYCGTE